ncbi:MAG: hypothetical protein JWN89_34 [Parcubacteria group bacterium]|nr:hypothetical protein [Parcubacteria group bacterium]
MADLFFLIFLGTIIFTRLFLYFKPIPAPTVGKFWTHHYMYGVGLVLLGLLIGSVVTYAVGLGLFVDELTYLLINGKNHEDNYSKKSLIGTLIFIGVVFFLREFLSAFVT